MSAREELSLLKAIGSLQPGQTREFHSHSKSFHGILIRTPSGFVATANCVFLCSGVCYHLQTLCLSTENMVVEFFARFFINVPGDLSPILPNPTTILPNPTTILPNPTTILPIPTPLQHHTNIILPTILPTTILPTITQNAGTPNTPNDPPKKITEPKDNPIKTKKG